MYNMSGEVIEFIENTMSKQKYTNKSKEILISLAKIKQILKNQKKNELQKRVNKNMNNNKN